MVGSSLSGKTYHTLKILPRLPDRDIYIIKKSTELYSKSKMEIIEIIEEYKPPNEYENAIIAFDDVLGTSNIK